MKAGSAVQKSIKQTFFSEVYRGASESVTLLEDSPVPQLPDLLEPALLLSGGTKRLLPFRSESNRELKHLQTYIIWSLNRPLLTLHDQRTHSQNLLHISQPVGDSSKTYTTRFEFNFGMQCIY